MEFKNLVMVLCKFGSMERTVKSRQMIGMLERVTKGISVGKDYEILHYLPNSITSSRDMDIGCCSAMKKAHDGNKHHKRYFCRVRIVWKT